MKKTFLILLVLLFCCATSIEAKVEFGNWSKWEKEFPSISRWEKYIDLSHSFYNQCTDTKTAYTVCSMFTCSICNERECKEKASVVLFSTKDKTMDDMYYGKGDYQFALVAFPPVENMVIIRAYKREKKILKFLEEWEIPFENNASIFPANETQFLRDWKEWTIEEGHDLERAKLPFHLHLLIFDKSNFHIVMPFVFETDWLLEHLKK